MSSKKPSSTKPACLCALALLCVTDTANAEPAPPDWSAQKCALYADGWQWVLSTQDLSGISSAFLTDHQRFIDAGCDHSIEICPQSGAEYALADLLTVISMNEGMASTFVPFACPQ